MITSSPASSANCRRVLAALAIASAPAIGRAQSPVVLTLGSAARMAAQQGAAPEAARMRVEQAEARVRQRRAELLPNLSGGVSEGERTFNSANFGITFRDPATGRPTFDPNGEVLGPVRTWDLRGTLRQSLADFSSYARVRAARAGADASAADASSVSQQAAAGAAAAYVRASRTEAQLAGRTADSTLASEMLGIARDQLSAGIGIALDLTRAQAQLATARAQLISARNERDRARLELQRALGLPLGTPIVLADSLTALAREDPEPGEQDATARALRSRADLRAADGQLRTAMQQLAAIKAERLPSLSAFADQGVTGKSTDHLLNTYTWGVQLSLPILDGFRREGRMDEQRSVMRELDLRRRDLAEQASLEVRTALLDLASAREQLAATDDRLALATQELAQARDRFLAGVTGNAEVITASVGLNAARAQIVDARASLLGARVAFARAQGALTELP